MIVRADRTGLGNQTWELWRHLQPAKTVIVIPVGGHAADIPQHPERYGEEATVCRWDPKAPALRGAEQTLRDTDIVISCETLYDPILHRRLDRFGTRTVIIANPELYAGEEATAIWTPTPWLNGQISSRAGQKVRVVPHPVPVDRYPDGPAADPHSIPRRIVHPTATAMADRNGTGIMAGIESQLNPERFTIDYVGPQTFQGRGRLVDEWWQRDTGAWVSVIPRRYGGLCLPALEAFAAGVPVIMPRTSPQDGLWPVIGIPARRGRPINTKGGRINTWTTDPGPLRSTLIELDGRPDRWAQAAAAVRRFAAANRWEAIRPEWDTALQDVIT